ncbi:Fatty acid hydroxylase [Phytophthora cactorum]|nr:Fatty acid hydroxylase [Phytophthora cactorum]
MKSPLFAVSTLQFIARRCKYYAFINAFICSVALSSYVAVSSLNREVESPMTFVHLAVVYAVSLLRILAMIKWFEWIATKKSQINGDKRVQLTHKQIRAIYLRILWLVVPTECVSFWFAEQSAVPMQGSVTWQSFMLEYVSFIPKSLVFEIIFDFFHFAMHWMCHYSTWLYKNVHKQHHLHLHPCPLSTYEQDGIDLCLTNVLPFCLAWILGFSFSDLQLHLLFAYKTYVEVAGHSGLDIKGFSFPQMPLVNNLTSICLRCMITTSITRIRAGILPNGFRFGTSSFIRSVRASSYHKYHYDVASLVVAFRAANDAVDDKSRTDPTSWPLVLTSLKVMVCQEVLVVVYPTYFYAFTTIPASGKTYFALLLPVLKLVFRNAMAKTVGYLSDEVPEGVILNVEVVSALFAAYCMQNTPSVKTTIMLMIVDVLQMSASLYDIETIIQRMKTLRKQIKHKPTTETHTRRINSEFNLAQDFFSQQTNSRKPTEIPSSIPKFVKKLSSAVQPVEPPDNLDQAASISLSPPHITPAISSSVELRYARLTFLVCFLVSIAAYLLMMYHLPNRAYYKQIDGMDKAQLWDTLSSVLLYAGLQLLSLIVLNFVLWHRMRLSGFRQLSFVLERQCSPVQNKLILWVFYNVQTALQHFGKAT